jgi:uncharacterized protein YdhG (YjbR/CyaY superfamily)
MKKRKSRSIGASAKRTTALRTVDDYMAGVPKPARGMLQQMRATIRSAVPPDSIETISYRMPAFKRKKILVWFAAFTNHCSLFPTAAAMDAFKSELKGYTISKGTVQFPLDKPLPTRLITRIVKLRVAQAEGNKAAAY